MHEQLISASLMQLYQDFIATAPRIEKGEILP